MVYNLTIEPVALGDYNLPHRLLSRKGNELEAEPLHGNRFPQSSHLRPSLADTEHPIFRRTLPNICL